MITFYTHSQHFTFIDQTGNATPASQLVGGAPYTVLVTIQNDAPHVVTSVDVTLSHSAVGIGYMAGTAGITDPVCTIHNVPPAEDAETPGLATASFVFQPPAGGHGCLYATIDPSGPSIGNNFDAHSATIGVASKYSFYVFGNPTSAEQMELRITETLGNGSPLGGSASWVPRLIAPPEVGLSSATAPAQIHLAADRLYLLGLQVTPPVGATGQHRFNIQGWIGGSGGTGGTYAGEVTVLVDLTGPTAQPDPYMQGGYQSADILIYDAADNLVPLGVPSTAQWDTQLVAGASYTIAAVVHNAAPVAADNTMLRFWAIPGGVGTAGGKFLEARTVSVPANGSIEVRCSTPFVAGALHSHLCAVVSLANIQSEFTYDATVSELIPSPTLHLDHSASAWRNTDASLIAAGDLFDIELHATPRGLIDPGDPLHRLQIEVETQLVPLGFHQQKDVAAIQTMLRQAGAVVRRPLYLLPSLREKLPRADLAVRIEHAEGKALERADKAILERATIAARLPPVEKQPNAPFRVRGEVPKSAKPGEIYLVHVIAHYPDAKGRCRAVEFTQFLHVTDKRRK